MKIQPSFNDAMSLDQIIYQLAAYDSSDGMIVVPENEEQALIYQKKVISRFNYFKRLIQNSELSFSELQRTVVERSGPFSNKSRNITSDQAIEKLMNEPKTKDSLNDYLESHDKVTGILQKLMNDIAYMTGQDPNMEDCNMLKSKISNGFDNDIVVEETTTDTDIDNAENEQPNTNIDIKKPDMKGKNGRIKKTRKNTKARKGKDNT